MLTLGACPRTQTAESVDPSEQPEASDPAPLSDPVGQSSRWLIDGTTLAADPRLPLHLDRALREHGRASEEVQDYILHDLNGDGELDAVALLPAPAVAGVYDILVLLSIGKQISVHSTAELLAGATFSAAIVPLLDGPTLVAVAPRLGGCERGPEWSFLRPTGDLLELVGSIRVEDYDCAVAEASVEFVRTAEGQVSAVELHHGDRVTRYRWDSSVGSFAVTDPSPLGSTGNSR